MSPNDMRAYFAITVLISAVALSIAGCDGPSADRDSQTAASSAIAASKASTPDTPMPQFGKQMAGELRHAGAAAEAPGLTTVSQGASGGILRTGGLSHSTLASNRTPPESLAAGSFRRQVIRQAELSVRVKYIEAAEKQVDRLIAGSDGYVDSASSSDLASDHPQLELTIRVPVAAFDSTLDSIQDLGVRLSKTISSQDVTGQLVDLDARLATMSAEEQTYRNMLRDSRSLDTTIQLQDKLTEVRSAIESMAGQRKTTAGLAALSTVKLTLTQDAIVGGPAPDRSWLAQTWGESTSTAAAGARLVFTVLIWCVTLSPFWVPIIIGFRKLLTKVRPNTATSLAPGSSIP